MTSLLQEDIESVFEFVMDDAEATTLFARVQYWITRIVAHVAKLHSLEDQEEEDELEAM